MEKIKVINKINYGVGFNALCVSLAGAITVISLNELYKLRIKMKSNKAIKDATKSLKTIDELLEYFEKCKETEEDKKGEEESQ